MARRLASPLAVALAASLAGLAFVFRSPIEHFLAPVAADYTTGSTLTAGYPRPGADLTPVWKVELEDGYGGATIDGDEVFVLDRTPGVGDTLRVLDLDTGSERWTFEYAAPGRLEFPGSRTRPAVTPELVYTCGVFGRVHAIDRRTRVVRWTVKLDDDLGGRLPDFGWAATPLVEGELVILTALGDDVGLVALDRFDGSVVWRTPGLGESHSTPVILELCGERQLLFLSATETGVGDDVPAPLTISAFDPRSGRPLWRGSIVSTSVPIPPPVRFDDEHVVITGGYGGGTTLLHVARTGEEYTLDEVFHVTKGAQLHPPVVHDGHVYLVANENRNEARRRRHEGGLVCLDRTGRELWSTGDAPYLGRGHLRLLGDYLLVQDGQSGILRIAAASPRGYVQLANSNVFGSEPKARSRTWAPMELGTVGGVTLVVRGRSELACVRLGDRRGERP